ncbi:photosystem I reaction center subunit XI [Leptolyngbya sp. FACHB-36]|uniref:photosystem I reaction center subunit XI n=1 Tax=Leptolyngbya sp. FACHB-36 TaxID=2692808 RepID=UPI001681B417|nr:photosystem I reaction center subunit XI [Leptolyngbya sp. FACHB-36]MBD2021644.1 photosystem I reaction center subunit XI [Leptolyngbya sp. FACHB-36]
MVEAIDRSKDRPSDPRNREVVFPANDPLNGNLATPINSSPLVRAYINNLPAYRQGLTPIRRGLEVGLAHGYWIVGPFAKFNPLRDTEVGTLTALFATVGLLIISTLAISLYGASNPPAPTVTITTPNPPEALKTGEGWNEYGTGFLIGGVGGAIVAYFILANVDVFKNFLNFIHV